MKKIVAVMLVVAFGWAITTWARSRRRRALDRQDPATVRTTRPQTGMAAPLEPLDGESLDPVTDATSV